MIRKLLLTTTCGLMLGTMVPEAHAAVLVSLGSEQPTTGHTIASLNSDNYVPNTVETPTANYGWRRHSTETNNWDLTLSFIASESGMLEELGLYLNGGQTGGGHGFTLTIREFSTMPAGANAHTAGNVILSTGGVIDLSRTPTSNDILQFAFTDVDVVMLEEGKWYTVAFAWTDASHNSKNFSIKTVKSGLNNLGERVSNGMWRKNPTGSNVHDTGHNLLFYANGSQVIPEPGTYAMIGLAAAAFAISRRRRLSRKA